MKKLLLISLCLWSVIPDLFSQSWQYFYAPSAYSSLVSNNIYSTHHDLSGNLWLATWGGGISKFDGTSWYSYTTESYGLQTNQIFDVITDNDGNAWLATNGAGIYRIGNNSRQFNINSEPTFLSDKILCATKDAYGNLWFGTEGGGALMWNGTKFSYLDINNSGLPNNTIRSILADQRGNLWFATWGGGLGMYDGNEWITYSTANSDLPADQLYDLAEGADGNIWIATNSNGVCLLNPVTEGFQKYNSQNAGIPNDVRCIAINAEGSIYIGTGNAGLFKKTGDNWVFYNTGNSALPGNMIQSLEVDDNDNIWVGTTTGLGKLTENVWTVYNTQNTRGPGPFTNTLSAQLIDHNGHHWVLANPGNISKYDGTNWVHYNSTNSPVPMTGLTAIAEDINGNIWVGTANAGVFRYDGSVWTNFNTSNSAILENRITSLACNSEGKIFCGTYQNGISIYDGADWSYIPPMSESLPCRYVNTLYIDHQQHLWVGSSDNGISYNDGQNWHLYNHSNSGFSNNYISSITEDKSGAFWFGTSNGIIKFDGLQWTPYTPFDSPIINGQVQSLAVDQNNHIWVGTTGGISVFNGNQWATFTLNKDGMNSNLIASILIDAQNNKWIATQDKGLSKLSDGALTFKSNQNWFVSPGGSGAGSSWSDALGDFAVALHRANPGDSIFVAAGTYQPEDDSCFVMQPGVRIFGGFNGTETQFAQRDLSAGFTSILKGNGSNIFTNLNNGLTQTAELNGFTLTGGAGNPIYGEARGGAMFNYGVSPTISSCIFKENTAATGGALANEYSRIVFTNCTFNRNIINSDYNGGAIYGERSQDYYYNCIFEGNQAGSPSGEYGAGGAFALNYCTTSFVNCLFNGNKSLGKLDGGGGAFFIESSTVRIYNSTFYNNQSTSLFNTTTEQGNAIAIGSYGTAGSAVFLTNSIIYGPKSYPIATFPNNSFTMSHSLVKDFYYDANKDGYVDSIDFIENLPYYLDPMFQDAAHNDFRLKPASPCINAGTMATDYYPVDLAGTPFFQDNKIDLGAYQSTGLAFSGTPGQKLTSDRSDTTSGGVIYLYNSAENTVIVGVNPNGQDLGNIEATGSLSENYGSGQPTTLESPFGVQGEMHCLNRSWHVTLTNPDFNSPVTVQFFIDTTDLRDLVSQMPTNTHLPQTLEEWKDFAPLIRVYKVKGNDAYAVGAGNYREYSYSEGNQSADLHHFTIGQYQQLFYLEFQVSEFSSGSVAYIPLATPVDLIDFIGTLNNGTTQFSWHTGQEVNFQQFELQWSLDGASFQTAGTVQPTGNNSTYRFTTAQKGPKVYYRLRLLDQNGKAAYSKIILLSQPASQFAVYPNPAGDYIALSTDIAGTAYIYDLSGKLVKKLSVQKGTNNIHITGLASGIYYINIGQGQQKIKLIKR